MKKLENIFLGLPGYNCFGCSPHNDIGLNLTFSWDSEKEEVYTTFTADEKYAGFKSILHGGIQSTLLDEIAFWLMFAKLKKLGFTTGMNIKYRAAVPTSKEIHIRAGMKAMDNKNVTIRAWIESTDGKILTEGLIEYKIVSLRFWKKHLGIETLPPEFNKYFE